MNVEFLYEDGHGNAYDENGNYAYDIEMQDNANDLQCLVSMTTYNEHQSQQTTKENDNDAVMESSQNRDKEPNSTKKPSTKSYNSYSDQQRHKFIILLIEKQLDAATAARTVGVHPRTGQRWAKIYYDDPEREVPYPKKDVKRGPKPKLLEAEHKDHVINFIDENATATVSDVIDSLTEAFSQLDLTKSSVNRFMKEECNLTFKKVHLQSVKRNSDHNLQERFDWATKYSKTSMNYLTNCVFIDESAFHINLKRSYGWSKKGVTPVDVVPTTRARTTTILGAISVYGVVQIVVRKPNQQSKKRRLGQDQGKKAGTGTNTNHYLAFLISLMDELDKFPAMKGTYLVMDNAPIIRLKESTSLLNPGAIIVYIFHLIPQSSILLSNFGQLRNQRSREPNFCKRRRSHSVLLRHVNK